MEGTGGKRTCWVDSGTNSKFLDDTTQCRHPYRAPTNRVEALSMAQLFANGLEDTNTAWILDSEVATMAAAADIGCWLRNRNRGAAREYEAWRGGVGEAKLDILELLVVLVGLF